MKSNKLLAVAFFSLSFFLAVGAQAGTREACESACKAEYNACVSSGGPSKATCLAELTDCRSGC